MSTMTTANDTAGNPRAETANLRVGESGVAVLTQSSNIAINLTMQRRGLPIVIGGRHEVELYEKMVKARTYRAANAQMRQLGFASIDLALHRDYDASRDGDAMAYARAKLQAFSPTILRPHVIWQCVTTATSS